MIGKTKEDKKDMNLNLIIQKKEKAGKWRNDLASTVMDGMKKIGGKDHIDDGPLIFDFSFMPCTGA